MTGNGTWDVHATECSWCGAKAGRPCTLPGGEARPMHRTRLIQAGLTPNAADARVRSQRAPQ